MTRRLRTAISLSSIRLIFIAAFLCVSIFMLATFDNMDRAERETNNVRSSLEFLLRLENLLVEVQAVENGQRGYIISGDEKYLDTYYSGLRNLRKDTAILAALPVADPVKAKERRELLDLVHTKLVFTKQVVETRRIEGYDSAAQKTAVGKTVMDDIHKLVLSMENKDRDLLKRSNIDRQKYAKRTAWQFFLLAGILYLILFCSFIIISRDYKKLKLNDNLLQYNASLIRNISDPIITTGTDYTITNWNMYAERLYGYKEEEVLGRPTEDVLRIDYNGQDVESVLKEFGEKHFWKGDVIHHHKDGSPIHVEVTTSAIIDSGGQALGTVAVIRDITTRKQTESDLKHLVEVKAKELNHIFERITDAFFALDKHWNYVYVNQKAALLHGRSVEELVGKNIWALFPEVKNEPLYDALHEAMESQKPLRLELYFSKTDAWYEDLIYPSADGISVYYHDITTKKKAEQAYLASNERFNLVAKATRDAIWDWDMLDDKLWGNDIFNQAFGGGQESMFNFKNFLERIHEEDRQEVVANLKLALQDKQPFISEEFRFRAPDGSYRIFYDRAYIIYDKHNTAIRMLGAMEDITEERESARKLLLEKELSDSIINRLPGIFYVINKNEQFLRWNRNFETVTGYSREEIPNIHPLDICVPEEREKLKGTLARVFEKGEDRLEARLMSKDGKETLFFYTGMTINYENETCIMGVGIDISEREKAQEELRRSEEKFRTLIEQASDGIFISDQAGNYIDVNTSASFITGYTKEELLQLNMRDIIDASDYEKVPFKLEQLKDGKVLITERVMKRKDGGLIDVEISAKLLPDGRFQGIVRDITARKKIEEKIRTSEEHRRMIMNSALDAIVCIDESDRITFWNPQAEKIFGWKFSEIEGKFLSDTIIPVPYRKMHKQGMKKYLATGEGPALNVLLELTATNRYGKEFPVELTVLPIKQGSDSFFCAFIRDISTRKKSEEELRVSEHKYRLLFMQNPMPMWMLSLPERDFIDVNPAALDFYGYSREEFLSMNIRDIRPPEELARMESTLANISPGINNVGIWTHRKKDGTEVKVNIISHDIYYENQNAKLVLANDVTDKIAAEESLRKSHEEFRQLASHLEHIRESERTHMAREIHDELGQQLTGLKMDISWLKRKIKSVDTEINQKINDTIELIDKTVITVRRIATELRPSILDDLGLVAAMEWQSSEFEKRSEIPTSFSSNLANINLPPEVATGLFRIFQECLTNITRHAAATSIHARLTRSDDEIILLIKDNGIGFDSAVIADKKTLGLLGMKERTTLMGGTYEIRSEPGRGTSVRIVVPLRQSIPNI